MKAEVFTFDETKKYLKISDSTLYRLVQSKRIPAAKVGRSWRFRKERIDEWLKEQEKTR